MSTTSAGTHQDRMRILVDLLDSLPADLPRISDWSSSTYRILRGDGPSVSGSLDSVTTAVGDRLDATREAMAAWADALGVQVVERLKGGTLNFSAACEVNGVAVSVRTYLYVSGHCDGCGGPVIGGQVYRHYTNTPCGGAA